MRNIIETEDGWGGQHLNHFVVAFLEEEVDLVPSPSLTPSPFMNGKGERGRRDLYGLDVLLGMKKNDAAPGKIVHMVSSHPSDLFYINLYEGMHADTWIKVAPTKSRRPVPIFNFLPSYERFSATLRLIFPSQIFPRTALLPKRDLTTDNYRSGARLVEEAVIP